MSLQAILNQGVLSWSVGAVFFRGYVKCHSFWSSSREQPEKLPASHCGGENAAIQLGRDDDFGVHLQRLSHPIDQAATTAAESEVGLKGLGHLIDWLREAVRE